MNNNKFFNPDEKTKSKRRIIKEFCLDDYIPKQKENIKIYKTQPNQFLIHDKNGNYKVVSKYYYFYQIEEDEYDTDTELIDEEWENEVIRIKEMYYK